MIIPKEYGGLGFSAFAHSEVVAKLASRSTAVVVTVMVPNSLGPGELLMHYGTEEQKRYYLPTAGQGSRNPMLCIDQSERGLGCRRNARHRHRLHGRIRRKADPRAAADVGQALHHARSGRNHSWPGLSRLRSGPPARRQGGPRHHLRADPDASSRRQHRPSPHAAVGGVPERAQLGQGRVRADGVGDRRAAHARQRVAHVDGVPCRGSLDLAAVAQHRYGEDGDARDGRLRARTHPVQDADRKIRRHRGTACTHRRLPLLDGRRAGS